MALYILQGYILRASDEFVVDCTLLLSTELDVKVVVDKTNKRTIRLFNCLHDIAALSSHFSGHTRYLVNEPSAQNEVRTVYLKLSSLLQSDKLSPVIDGLNKGHHNLSHFLTLEVGDVYFRVFPH